MPNQYADVGGRGRRAAVLERVGWSVSHGPTIAISEQRATTPSR